MAVPPGAEAAVPAALSPLGTAGPEKQRPTAHDVANTSLVPAAGSLGCMVGPSCSCPRWGGGPYS